MVANGQRVSVIIPVHQGEQFVKHAIDSALNQTHDDLEVLVIDDGSTDGTWKVLEAISDDRVRIFHQENAGVSVARNVGIANATGQYIALLDADDLWLPHKLTSELEVFAARGYPVGIVYSWFYCITDDGMLSRPSPRVKHSGKVLGRLLNASPFIIPSASLYHRDVFSSVGLFDTKRRYHEDFAFLLRACREYPAFPTSRYSALYKQSMNGKARKVMSDYASAIEAAQSISRELEGVLSDEEREMLLRSSTKELYFRFLMYGFNASAKRLLQQIPVDSLPGSAKGWLGWIFAKTNINLMMPTRQLIQRGLQYANEKRWRRFLIKSGLPMRVAPEHA